MTEEKTFAPHVPLTQDEEAVLKKFSGMIRYTCNTLDGVFNLTRAASALGVTNEIVEVLLEIFQDAGMIKIKDRNETSYEIEFIAATELSKTLHSVKYEEFAELMKNVNEYKNKFMSAEIETYN